MSSIRTEFLPMLKIAVPVVMAELGWMAMGVVDTVMVGPLGPEAISAAGVGNAMHIAFAIFGMGVMLGLDTLVSQAYGARDIRECHRWLFDGLTLAGLMAVPIMALLVLVWFAIPSLGFHAAVRPLLESYFGVLMLEHAVPARLCGVPPLPAGDARGHAGDVRARHRQPDQRRRQLGADLRPLRLSGARRRRIGVGDGDLARLHARRRCCSRCGGSIASGRAELLRDRLAH